jgi:hypothetical protein
MMARGIAAEYDELRELVAAIRAVRARGIDRVEAYTPFPVPELDEVLGAKPSPLSFVAAIGAVLGAGGGYALQWLLNAYLYPVNAGGRPPHMPLAFVIITIEMGFLFGGLAVFFGAFVAARLAKLWEPIADADGFASATRAGFWLAIDSADPRYDAPSLAATLRATRPKRLELFGDES